MTDGGKKLGVFWGNDAVYFVETEGGAPKKVFHIPLDKTDNANLKKDAADPGKSKLVFAIKNALTKNKSANSAANLSLPTRDIIFRSFIIPWMQPHEIKNVVEFEIGKYIPFALEELSFTFHPITIENTSLKQIRIIFVAIKKDALKTYSRILKGASLNVHSIEPAALSLIRALSVKSVIPNDETIAIIEKEHVGRIIIVDHETPQFVREFHLSALSDATSGPDTESDLKKLGKEARISLEYFNRQNEQLQVKKIFLLALSNQSEAIDTLKNFLNIPSFAIDHQSIIKDIAKTGLGSLNAFGASIVPSAGSLISFSTQREQEISDAKLAAAAARPKINLKLVIKTAVICVPVIVGAFLWSTYMTDQFGKKISDLQNKLGPFQDAEVADIQQQAKALQDKLAYFKNTRTSSNIAFYLTLLPELLPEGAWINTLRITYDDTKFMASAMVADPANTQGGSAPDPSEIAPTLTLTIDGYAFSDDKNLQFRLVKTFLGTLKDNEQIAKYFNDIDLETTKIERINDQEVTSFTIVCSRAYELTGSPKH